jgi:membrane protein DedA with SNARE-associated domain
MSKLPRTKTLVYASVSSLTYYGLLAVVGYYFGKDWQSLLEFLHIYEQVAITIVIGIIFILLVIWLFRKTIKKSFQ